ncbi:hypothetical protein SLEP1_g54996 [Rubroshorea leprosula]|uniref:Uncharacterized protein n=1 Tax=Rubroshorea leprosula TaxID=152421 RepID=A0AAV5MEE5_9ROSI|nr:hypothetical protein SLEP1_g54996 [Rubroshorea leprosula]
MVNSDLVSSSSWNTMSTLGEIYPNLMGGFDFQLYYGDDYEISDPRIYS